MPETNSNHTPRRKPSVTSPKSTPTGRRARKNQRVREAELIEALFIARNADELDESTAQRADLVSDILFDVGNESGVHITHPQLVKAYVLATFDELTSMDDHSYEAVLRAFSEIHEVMNGCSPERYDEIDYHYNPDYEERHAPKVVEPVESAAIRGLREKLETLERLPENEAVAFQLESEIDRLERENTIATEWPDVIGGGHDA